jgi:hypothetical protein
MSFEIGWREAVDEPAVDVWVAAPRRSKPVRVLYRIMAGVHNRELKQHLDEAFLLFKREREDCGCATCLQELSR